MPVKAFRTGVQLPASPPKMEKTDNDVRFFFLEDCGEAPLVLCANAHLNPGTGLAFIRSCKHAHFTITACIHACNSPNGISIVIYLRFFFLEDCGEAPLVLCANAHLNPGTGLAFIRSCKHAHFSITARVDDIQGYALIYLRKCDIINSPKIQNL